MTSNANPCGLTSDDYRNALYDTMPRGKAWPRRVSGVFGALWGGIADHLMRFQRRCCDLLNVESFPGTAVELLPDWERALGLPDPCVTDTLTVAQRHAAAVAKIAGAFNPTPANFILFGAALGYTITITYPSAYVWVVHAPATSIVTFRAGMGVAGEPLRSWGNTLLECSFQERCPAHTHVAFAYS